MATPRAEIAGRCVKEPFMGTDKNGKPYIFVRVATSDSQKDGDEWITMRELFVNVQLFNANPNMRIPEVGDHVRAFGSLFEEKTEKDGKTYLSVNCNAEYLKSYPKVKVHRQGGSGWGGMVEKAKQQKAQDDPWGGAGVPPEPPLDGGEPPF